MSRRKDQERLDLMKSLNPDYKGFRGYQEEPTRQGKTLLEAVTCSVCGHKRNVPLGIAQKQRDAYICLSCRESAEAR
ncbi:MAG: hypothetical protein HY666_06355 [Chloroflexi bacterium]|nr:hypothetical protein [Chloroflexota bacterium]